MGRVCQRMKTCPTHFFLCDKTTLNQSVTIERKFSILFHEIIQGIVVTTLVVGGAEEATEVATTIPKEILWKGISYYILLLAFSRMAGYNMTIGSLGDAVPQVRCEYPVAYTAPD